MTEFRDRLSNRESDQDQVLTGETFKRAFEYAAFGMVLVGIDGRLLSVNRSACNIFGHAQKELIHKTFQELTYPNDLEKGFNLFRDFVTGKCEYSLLEIKHARNDGEVIWALIGISAVRNAEGSVDYLVLQTQDITDRKRTESDLAEKEAQYRSIFEATQDGLIVNELDGTIIQVNPAFCDMHGYDPEDLIGLHPHMFIHPDYHPLFIEYLQTVKKGDVFLGRAIDLHKDGTPFHVEVHGSPFIYKGRPHVLGVVRNISDQVQAQEKLEEEVNARTRELAALYCVTAVASASLDLDHVMKESLARILDVMGCEIGSIHLLDETNNILNLAAWQGTPKEVLPEIESMQLGQGVAGRVIAHEGPLSVPAIGSEATAVPAAGRLLAGHAYVGAPMQAKGKVLGVLSVIGPVGRQFNEDEIALLASIADQVGVAVENAQLYKQAEALAVSEERRRIAREIHDTLAQGFTGINIQLDAVESALEMGKTDQVIERLGHARELANQSLAEARRSVWALRTGSGLEIGLSKALSDSVRGLTANTGLEISLELQDDMPRIPIELQTDLLRVAQEAVTNVIKHALAKHLLVRLTYESNNIVLEIKDDGRGFIVDNTQDCRGDGGGFGLTAMRERLTRHNGELQIESLLEGGTKITATVKFVANEKVTR